MNGAIAIILAGGRGKRMDILCYTRPKPALPFAGRFRVIDFSLSNCINSQINNVAVLSGYQRSHLANYIKRWKYINAKSHKFSIIEPEGNPYKGTADAIYQNLNYLQNQDGNRVLVLAGDHIYKMDYRQMLAFHEQAKADVTVGVVSVPFEQTYRFGTVTLDTDNRILGFIEKSETAQTNLASMGIYIFNKEFLIECLNEDAAEAASSHDFGYAILPKIVKKNRVFTYRFDGYWQDIGTIEAYYEANMQVIQKDPSFSLNDTWPILTDDNKGIQKKESHQGSIENSLISDGCVIKGRVENSILSPGVWIDEQTVVRNSILMSNVFVGYHSTVESCILDESVSIGKICYLGFGVGQTGVAACTVVGRDVTVPSHTAIGRNCRIAPYSDLVDFTKTVIPKDYHLSNSQRPPRNNFVGETSS